MDENGRSLESKKEAKVLLERSVRYTILLKDVPVKFFLH